MEYDPVRDLLYIWFGTPEEKAAQTQVIAPGVHADFDRNGRLIGIEVLDAADVMQQKVQFELLLQPQPA